MDGNIFPEGVPVPDLNRGWVSAVLQVLATGPNAAEWIKFVVSSNPDGALDHEMGVEPGAVTDLDVVTNNAVRADLYLGSDFGLGGDNGGRMNHDGAAEAAAKATRMNWGGKANISKLSRSCSQGLAEHMIVREAGRAGI